MFNPGVMLKKVIDMFVLVGNNDTSLLLFLKEYAAKYVNSNGTFNTFDIDWQDVAIHPVICLC